jgi:hypothetical protein
VNGISAARSVSNASLSNSISHTLRRLITLHRSIINAALHNCTDASRVSVFALAQTGTFSGSRFTSDFSRSRVPGRRKSPLNSSMTIFAECHDGRGRTCRPRHLLCSSPSPRKRKDQVS